MRREKEKRISIYEIEFSKEEREVVEGIYGRRETKYGEIDRLELLSYGSLFIYLMREALGCGGGGT
ncbi:MAG: hypothetical protein RMJ51_04395 [Candidatus Calescibacterium sp.]|nr:hypothetical protein [Candidatus Calescibacterium sp.]MDW8195459.1 hypothetical protein [Candidatus Calescibacterium sp.]